MQNEIIRWIIQIMILTLSTIGISAPKEKVIQVMFLAIGILNLVLFSF